MCSHSFLLGLVVLVLDNPYHRLLWVNPKVTDALAGRAMCHTSSLQKKKSSLYKCNYYQLRYVILYKQVVNLLGFHVVEKTGKTVWMCLMVFIRVVVIICRPSALEVRAVHLSFFSKCRPVAPHKLKTKAGNTPLSFERFDRLDTLLNVQCKTCCCSPYYF